jgi:hypothetical protein
MSYVWIKLDTNNCVDEALEADTVEEAQERAGDATLVQHINGMPFMRGWFWNGERFEER